MCLFALQMVSESVDALTFCWILIIQWPLGPECTAEHINLLSIGWQPLSTTHKAPATILVFYFPSSQWDSSTTSSLIIDVGS